MAGDDVHAVELAQEEGYRFGIRFGDGPAGVSDLAPPLGAGAGPSPEHLLAAAIGSCLASSLLFSLQKLGQSPAPMRARVETRVGRNDKKRLRVQEVRVRLDLGVPAAGLQHLDRALASFEDFCTVTASVRAAIPVVLEVFDANGERLK
jgi:organic hydroperoxide reductase OsmC/OhrA